MKILNKLLFLVLSLIIPLILFFTTYLFMDSYLVIEEPLEKSSIVYVPAGNWIYRIPTAVNIVKNRWADRIYIGQGEKSDPKKKAFEKYGVDICTTKNNILNFLTKEEIIGQAIFLKETRSTREEMEALFEEHKKNNFSKIIIVTDPPYTRRTKMLFKRAFKGSNVRSILYPSNSRNNYKILFAEDSDYKIEIFVETLKYFYYLFS